MKGFIRAITLALFVITPLAFSEDEMRDFYAEPGMNPFRTSAGQDVTENIDPFSGNVQLSYVDLSIPGNGGLDINIFLSDIILITPFQQNIRHAGKAA